MNRYEEMKARHQKEFNELPIGWGFDREQFDTMMKGWGLDPDKDLDKIASIGAGGYIQKKDVAQLKRLTAKQKKEMNDAVTGDATGDGFIYEMFFYELNNHEYGYTGDETEALAALGYNFKKIESDIRLKHGLEKAKTEIMRSEYEEAEASEIPAVSESQPEKKIPQRQPPAAAPMK